MMYLQLLLLSGKWGLPKSRVLQHCLSRPSPELPLDHNKKAIEAPQRINGFVYASGVIAVSASTS
jgi:hypothetical protein